MSCLHPLVAQPTGRLTENGKREYKIIGLGTFNQSKEDRGHVSDGSIPIPCGKCIGCRLDYSRAWADRMMLELDHTKKAVFVTLTYDNDHVPFLENVEGQFCTLTLCKRDAQLFMKRLRKRFSDREIRFYLSGEYGSTTERPHYHAIIFGLSLDDFPDKLVRGKNELGQIHYSSEILAGIWKNGFVVLGDVSWQTCSYVSRYVSKKVFQCPTIGETFFGAEPEFSIMSRNPGIGGKFLEDNPRQVDTSKWFVFGKPEGIRPGRFFTEKIALQFPEKFDKIKEEKRAFARDRNYLKLLKTDLSLVEQYEIQENDKLEKASLLKRRLE